MVLQRTVGFRRRADRRRGMLNQTSLQELMPREFCKPGGISEVAWRRFSMWPLDSVVLKPPPRSIIGPLGSFRQLLERGAGHRFQ